MLAIPMVPLYLWGITRCCCLKPSDIHVFGGFTPLAGTRNLNEGYDIAGDSWTLFEEMPTARFSLGAFSLAEGTVDAFAGVEATGSPIPYTREVEEYTKATDSWETRIEMPLPNRSIPSYAAVGGKGYVAGGFGATVDTDEYDRDTDSWADKSDMPATRDTPGHAETGGQMYVFGGSGVGGPQDDTFAFEPVGDSWSTKTDMANPASNMNSAGIDGEVYSWYGSNPGLGNDPLNRRYTTATDAWDLRTNGPLPVRGAGEGVAYNGLGYSICGSQGGGNPESPDTDRYDPSTDTWTSLEDVVADSGRRLLAGAAVT